MPRREGSVLSAFPFPRKGPGCFLSRGGKDLPVCFVEGFRISFCFVEGFRPFLFSLRGSNLSLCSSKGSVCFLFRGRKGADFPEGCVERFRVFFCSKGSEFFQGGEDFRSRRVAFPRATVLSTSPGRTSEDEGIQLPGSSRSPVDQRFFRKRTDSCFPLFFFLEQIQPFSFFIEGMEIGRDRGFRFFFFTEGMDSLNLLRGERRKET